MSVIEKEAAAGEIEAVPVKAAYELDQGAARYRLGLITLSSDQTVERDFANMRPGQDVATYVSRVLQVNPVTVENLRRMAPLITESAALILPETRIDAIAYCCTSGTVAIGYEAVAASIHAAHPGVPCVTPITAGMAALRRLGARQVAVLTPYVDEVNGPIVAYLQDHGFDVVALTSFLLEDDNRMAEIPAEAIYEAALEADRPEAEALFISCTAVRAVDVVERIEQALGKPVVTSNQALFWESLRAAGFRDAVAGYGGLLRLPVE